MEVIGELIRRGLALVGDDDGLAAIAAEVRALCERFPVYRKGSPAR